MQVKYQIFISSTFEDLKDERRAVTEAILNLGHIPVGMELFQAGNESQWSYIRKRIRQCDYYLVIVAERYGSEGSEGKSYTQMEYEFAVAEGVPVAAFLLDEKVRKTWERGRVQFDKLEKVDAFRALCQTRISNYWKNADELSARVLTSLNHLFNEYPRVGWVRADAWNYRTTFKELVTISEENRESKSEIDVVSGALLSMPDDVRLRLSQLEGRTVSEFFPSTSIKMTLLELIQHLWPFLNDGCSWSDLSDTFIRLCGVENISYYSIQPVMIQLKKMAMIDANSTGYQLTDYGRKCLLYISASFRERITSARV